MKAVLISIQPKWCELIASRKKVIEIRKSVPKLPRPFKCYIYCTKGKPTLVSHKNDVLGLFEPQMIINGKVIGEFMCCGIMAEDSTLLTSRSCMAREEINEYARGKTVYGWRIADLKIYDKAKELGEFSHFINRNLGGNRKISISEQIERPPQSWCYVEETD